MGNWTSQKVPRSPLRGLLGGSRPLRGNTEKFTSLTWSISVSAQGKIQSQSFLQLRSSSRYFMERDVGMPHEGCFA